MELKDYIPDSRVFLAMMLRKLMFASPEHAKWRRHHKKLFMSRVIHQHCYSLNGVTMPTFSKTNQQNIKITATGPKNTCHPLTTWLHRQNSTDDALRQIRARFSYKKILNQECTNSSGVNDLGDGQLRLLHLTRPARINEHKKWFRDIMLHPHLLLGKCELLHNCQPVNKNIKRWDYFLQTTHNLLSLAKRTDKGLFTCIPSWCCSWSPWMTWSQV